MALPISDGSHAKGDVAQLQQCKNHSTLAMLFIFHSISVFHSAG